VRDLVVLHLRSSLNLFREYLLHFCIGCAAVSFRILFLIPEADPDRFQSPRGDQGDFVLEAFLFSQQGNDFVLKGPAKLRNVVAFQTHGDTSTDRKSTRLNSSHVAISYAVFCLKKKKKEKNRI